MGEWENEMFQRQMIALKRKFRRLFAAGLVVLASGVAWHGEYPLAAFFGVGSIALWWRSFYP